MCNYPELHRLCFQLDRVRGDKRCGSVPVSTGDTPLTASGLIRTFRYGMQYHGQMALFTSILVAFTQIIPEHQVQIFGFLRARVKVMLPPLHSISSSISETETANGIYDVFRHHDPTWFPMSVYRHPVWMVCVMDISSLLQAQCHGHYRGRCYIWRPERNVCSH